MADNISKIKDRLSVVDVVSGYLKLNKAWVNFKAPCPFHNEKTPSFFVSPERQTWKCFGCSKGGSIFDFIMEMEGVEFSEALRILAAKAGIELEEFDSIVKDVKDRLYQVCEASTRFFEKQLKHSDTGKRALEYLQNRGLLIETADKFRLGFAPDTWDALTKYLRNSGFSEKEIIDAGVIFKHQPTTYNLQPTTSIYDRFRSRIMFPISDTNGRVVGFTGRIFEDENPRGQTRTGTRNDAEKSQRNSASSQRHSAAAVVAAAKYINTPQTLIYDKSRILYGLNHSRGDIRKKDKCLLVEGNMDVIMSYQAGVTNVVASSGTALTPMHLTMLKKITNNLDFCFDTDSAGAMATKRGIGMALNQNFNVKIVPLDDPERQANGAGRECKDPADYVKKYGKKWEEVVSSAQPIMEFYFNKAKEGFIPESAESKKGLISVVAPFVKRLSSRVERAHWISQLAFLMRAKEDAVESDILSAPDDLNIYGNVSGLVSNSGPEKVYSNPEKTETPDVLSEALLSLAIKKPMLFREEILSFDRQFLNPFTSQVFAGLSKENLDEFNFSNFIKKFDSNQSLDLEFAYLRAQSLWDNFEDSELKIEFSSIFNKLRQKAIHLRLINLEYDMRSAENAKDKDKIAVLAGQFNELTQTLAEIHNL